MAQMHPDDARGAFHRMRLDRRADFHTLRSEEVERVLAEADRVRYRKSKNAPGSRARMFWQYLQRRAGN